MFRPGWPACYIGNAPNGWNHRGENIAANDMAKHTPKRRKSQSLKTVADEADVRRLVELEAEAILLACEWGQPGDADPKNDLALLLGFVARRLEAQEGLRRSEGAWVYEGHADIEGKARKEWERLRLIYNRNPGNIETIAKVEQAAQNFSRDNPSGAGGLAAAMVKVYLAGLSSKVAPAELPSFTDMVKLGGPTTQALAKQHPKTIRKVFLDVCAKDVPELFLPDPFGPRQQAALSILLGVPTPSDLASEDGKRPTVASVIDAEVRRLLKP
jgi:hypothetical protein